MKRLCDHARHRLLDRRRSERAQDSRLQLRTVAEQRAQTPRDTTLIEQPAPQIGVRDRLGLKLRACGFVDRTREIRGDLFIRVHRGACSSFALMQPRSCARMRKSVTRTHSTVRPIAAASSSWESPRR